MKKLKTTRYSMVFWRMSRFPFIEAAPGFKQEPHQGSNKLYLIPSLDLLVYPICVIELEAGKELKSKLDALNAEHAKALATFYNGYKARLKQLANWME